MTLAASALTWIAAALVFLSLFGGWFVLLWCAPDNRDDRDSRHASAAAVLAAILSLPQWGLDSGETRDERVSLLRPLATAIAVVTSNRDEQAFLVAQSWHETRFARYVLENRCSDGPIGVRCDEGRATGPFQPHRWCREAWRRDIPYSAQYAAGARCALQQYRRGIRVCGTPVGGFAAQTGRALFGDRCAPQWARKREVTRRKVLVLL